MKNNVIRAVITLSAVILTAKLGRIEYQNHIETWYNLPMDNIIERTDEVVGQTDLYNIREDRVKCYGPFVIVAAHPSVTRYTFIETSLGIGIVLDTQTTGEPDLYDIAVNW